MGCYNDGSERTLYDGPTRSSNTNTISSCLSYCSAAGFGFGGVEYGSECYCGSAIRAGAASKVLSACDAMACSGNGASVTFSCLPSSLTNG